MRRDSGTFGVSKRKAVGADVTKTFVRFILKTRATTINSCRSNALLDKRRHQRKMDVEN